MLRLLPRQSVRSTRTRTQNLRFYSATQPWRTQSTQDHSQRQASSSGSNETPSTNTPDPSVTEAGPSNHSHHPQTHSTPETSKTPVEAVDVEQVKERLRTWAENAAVALRGRADQYTSSAIKSFAQLGRELNKVTGYQEIEALKRAVASQEARISAAREAAKEAKVAYDHAVHQRAKSQREVNDLLQRKSSWTDDDVGRFTALVRQDHLFEQAENRAKKAAQHTEDEVEREFSELMRVILNRYHEEQVWSDKIRSASTYGQLTVLGLNMFVFILAIILVEPWKRKRLAQTFERKVEEMTETTSKAFQDETRRLVEQLGKQADEIDRLREAVTYSLQPSAVLLHEAGVADLANTGESSTLPTTKTTDQSHYVLVHGQTWHAWTLAAATSAAAGVLGCLAGYYLSH